MTAASLLSSSSTRPLHLHFMHCVHLHLLQHSSLKTRRSIKALSCHLKLSSLKTRKEQEDGGYKFRIQ
ncbi:hypothetical protein P8452_31401 [Trifolium repens]|nr:hypothetical protein P8452_31401 [Trifolium repens]